MFLSPFKAKGPLHPGKMNTESENWMGLEDDPASFWGFGNFSVGNSLC